MQTPLPSVTALARFSFTEPELVMARSALLAEQDWQSWINQVEAHGLSGFVCKHIEDHDLPIPDALTLPLKALKIRHRAMAAARFKALSEIDAAFNNAGIKYLALKGAALMPYLFKQDTLRPMRDMDLLIKKQDEQQAAQVLRDIGFDLPQEQPSKFMRDMHQLPNATKTVDGFTCSVELHRDAISREVTGHLFYPESSAVLQTIDWDGLKFNAFDDITMLHQVCRHLEGLHPGGTLKLINVMDVIGLAEHSLNNGDWQELKTRYPHVITSLQCLHLLTPLPSSLQAMLELPTDLEVSDLGQIMGSLRSVLARSRPLKERAQLLFRPSNWWLHLYYNVSPQKSLFWVKWLRHPMRVSNWLIRRLYSGLLGG